MVRPYLPRLRGSCRLRHPHTVQRMLAAFTRINHESFFAASRSPAKVDQCNWGLPNQRVIAGYDHHTLTLAESVPDTLLQELPRISKKYMPKARRLR